MTHPVGTPGGAPPLDAGEVLRVVRNLVSIPSANPPGGEAEVVRYIRELLQAAGLECALSEALPGRCNLLARIPGRGDAPAVMLTGHTDVAPVSDAERGRWETPPFGGEVRDGRLYGRGAADMKGGLGAALVAFLTLARSGIAPPGDVIFCATVDEEDLMRGAKYLVATGGLGGVGRVVVCEPTELRIAACSKGRTWAHVVVGGRTAHASLPGAGVNAIHHAVRFASELLDAQPPYTPHPVLGDSWWQVTEISGGIEPAVVPDSCALTVDARLIPSLSSRGVWEHLGELIRRREAEVEAFSARIEVVEERDPWETGERDPVVRALRSACEAAGVAPALTGFPGTTDGTVFRAAGLVGAIFGPGSLAAVHRENEHVPVTELEQAARTYLHLMLAGLPGD